MDKKKFALEYLKKIQSLALKLDVSQIEAMIDVLENALEQGVRIFIAGNGGSAATASHMVCDFNKTVLGKGDKKGFRAVCLSDNVPMMTALGNDESFDFIFSRQLEILAQKEDLLLVITGSGNSKNIVEAVKAARKIGMKTLAFLGFDGGVVKKIVDVYILVPSFDYGPVEDFHLIFDHLITGYFKER